MEVSPSGSRAVNDNDRAGRWRTPRSLARSARWASGRPRSERLPLAPIDQFGCILRAGTRFVSSGAGDQAHAVGAAIRAGGGRSM